MPGPDLEALLVHHGQVGRSLTGPSRVLRHRPLRRPLVEVLGVVDVVAAPQLGLDPEEVLGVPQVANKGTRHL